MAKINKADLARLSALADRMEKDEADLQTWFGEPAPRSKRSRDKRDAEALRRVIAVILVVEPVRKPVRKPTGEAVA